MNRLSLNSAVLLLIPLTLPAMVLISPLCEMYRKGWASFHLGVVLVEKRL